MQLTIIGCGTIDLKRHSSSYYITTNKLKLLFDIGRGTIDNLNKAKIDPYSIDAIFISHFHSDHCIELIPFISAVIYIPEYNPKQKRLKEKYIIYGPPDINTRITQFLSVFEISKEQFEKKFQIVELEPNTIIKLGDLKIKTYPITHDTLVESIAFRITHNNKSLFYSGDCKNISELVEGCNNTDVALVECTLPKNPVHLNGLDVGKMAEHANVKKLIITHIALDYISQSQKEVSTFYSGKLVVAKEFLKIKI